MHLVWLHLVDASIDEVTFRTEMVTQGGVDRNEFPKRLRPPEILRLQTSLSTRFVPFGSASSIALDHSFVRIFIHWQKLKQNSDGEVRSDGENQWCGSARAESEG